MAFRPLVLSEAIHVELADEALQIALAKIQWQQCFFEALWVENGEVSSTTIP